MGPRGPGPQASGEISRSCCGLSVWPHRGREVQSGLRVLYVSFPSLVFFRGEPRTHVESGRACPSPPPPSNHTRLQLSRDPVHIACLQFLKQIPDIVCI